MADGTGAGTPSGTTLRVGSGNAGALRLLFELLLLLLFSFAFASGLASSSASGEGAASGLAFAFTFAAGGVIVPPDGNPDSGLPVGGDATCTGWLFGSAASDWFVC